MRNSTFIIAVAGHSGAGKSTLVKNLATRLGDAITLGIDDYPFDSYPRAVAWLEQGADPNEFQTPQFFSDVRALKEGKTIIHPETKQAIAPTQYVIIEEPFGRGRDALREYIDFLVYVDTPLEVAYVRKLLRKSDFLPWEADPQVFIEHLRENMEWYLRVGRNFYLAVSQAAMKNCDLVVSGLLPAENITTEIHTAIMKKTKQNPRVAIQTELGKIVVELYPAQAPITVNNFLRYVTEHRWDGAAFYRVVRADNQANDKIKIDVIQGDFLADGHPHRLPPIPIETTQQTGLRHANGTLSMGRINSVSVDSEFFICIGDQPELDFGGKRNPDGIGFAAFGKVIEGLDVVHKIHQSPAKEQSLEPPIAITGFSLRN